MRRKLAAGLAGLFVLGAMVSGCGKSDKTATPPMMEVPKEGPVPVGGQPKGKNVSKPGGGQSSDQ